jgi:hypothetical protein
MREPHKALFGCMVLIAITVASVPALAQDAGNLVGTITRADKTPIHRAHIRIAGTSREIETLPDGSFRIDNLPPGRYTVELRMLGFAAMTREVDIASGATVEMSVSMTAVVVALDTVNVSARAIPAYLRDFEERRARGGGKYFTRPQIDRMNPRSVTDILRRVPGFQFQPVRASDGFSVQTGRTGTRVCPVMYFLNGSPFPVGADQSINSFIDPDVVVGVEIYSGASSIPPQFNSSMYSSRCGVIVIWTRAGMEESAAR